MTKYEIEKQKSLALAGLVGWELQNSRLLPSQPPCIYHNAGAVECLMLDPYNDTDRNGLAQFAAILLKFPEAMACQFSTVCLSDGSMLTRNTPVKPTQANILDEILKLNNKWQEEWND